jgi:hypothetical protein
MLWEYDSKRKTNVNNFVKIFSDKIERGYSKDNSDIKKQKRIE